MVGRVWNYIVTLVSTNIIISPAKYISEISANHMAVIVINVTSHGNTMIQETGIYLHRQGLSSPLNQLVPPSSICHFLTDSPTRPCAKPIRKSKGYRYNQLSLKFVGNKHWYTVIWKYNQRTIEYYNSARIPGLCHALKGFYWLQLHNLWNKYAQPQPYEHWKNAKTHSRGFLYCVRQHTYVTTWDLRSYTWVLSLIPKMCDRKLNPKLS